jgi:hypothetical protein
VYDQSKFQDPTKRAQSSTDLDFLAKIVQGMGSVGNGLRKIFAPNVLQLRFKYPKNADLNQRTVAVFVRPSHTMRAAAPPNQNAKELPQAVERICPAVRSQWAAQSQHSYEPSERGASSQTRRVSPTGQAIRAQNWLGRANAARLASGENTGGLTRAYENARLEPGAIVVSIHCFVRILFGDTANGTSHTRVDRIGRARLVAGDRFYGLSVAEDQSAHHNAKGRHCCRPLATPGTMFSAIARQAPERSPTEAERLHPGATSQQRRAPGAVAHLL